MTRHKWPKAMMNGQVLSLFTQLICTRRGMTQTRVCIIPRTVFDLNGFMGFSLGIYTYCDCSSNFSGYDTIRLYTIVCNKGVLENQCFTFINHFLKINFAMLRLTFLLIKNFYLQHKLLVLTITWFAM